VADEESALGAYKRPAGAMVIRNWRVAPDSERFYLVALADRRRFVFAPVWQSRALARTKLENNRAPGRSG